MKATEMPRLQRGDKIVVYDEHREELGEGTFSSLSSHQHMLVYECVEHTILAKYPHYLKAHGETHRIQSA